MKVVEFRREVKRDSTYGLDQGSRTIGSQVA